MGSRTPELIAGPRVAAGGLPACLTACTLAIAVACGRLGYDPTAGEKLVDPVGDGEPNPIVMVDPEGDPGGNPSDAPPPSSGGAGSEGPADPARNAGAGPDTRTPEVPATVGLCNLGTTEQCSACDDNCNERSPPGADSLECISGSCAIAACVPGREDCDGEFANGCETDLTSLDDCGACANPCRIGQAETSCQGGSCELVSCEQGFGDCDNDAKTGCERALNTLSDCGTCDVQCARENGLVSCEGGSCELIDCLSGFADCDGEAANGCETPLDTPSDCGACGAVCDIPGAENESCSGGVCSVVTCIEPFADCDADGHTCETDLTSLSDCGVCGEPCGDGNGRLDNATATCESGTCSVRSCDPGWEDCDAAAANGCETATTTLSDCGACAAVCSRDNATAGCVSGSCEVESCNPGWGDCDGVDSTGCEASLDSDAHCGGCNQPCAANETCEAGACVGRFASYVPSNFDPDPLVPANAPDLVLGCGSITLDTTTLTAEDWCGAPVPEIVVQSQVGGSELAVVTLKSLRIASGTTLSVTGHRPVAFAVFGDVDIAGVIDVSARGGIGGPGEHWQCLDSNGGDGSGSASAGGGGGGGAAYRAAGGDGGYGDSRHNGGIGGVARGSDWLSPLIPGCRGGTGGGCSARGGGGGGGGGALQVSATGQLIVTGSLLANGGDGVQGCGSEGGGSGGGSGGAILLEADDVAIAGSLLAIGGDGGDGATGGDGGIGSDVGAGQDGSSHSSNGGGGGGGSAGRIRIFAVQSCSDTGTVLPAATMSCP